MSPSGCILFFILAACLCTGLTADPAAVAPPYSAQQQQINRIVDGFIANLTAPVEQLLQQNGQTLVSVFGDSTRQLCERDLFANGSYAENFNSTKSNIIGTLERIRDEKRTLRERARADLRHTMRLLRAHEPVGAGFGTRFQHDIITFAYIYQQYERGYRFVHAEYGADVQCNYALMYGRGLAVENLTETDNTAHVSYQNIVQHVQRINVENRRQIERQTATLLSNVAKSLKKIGRELIAL